MKRKVIDLPQIRAAYAELERFRQARAPFDARIADEERYYRLRVQPRAHLGERGEAFAPTSAWLLNTVLQKHAELMERMPAAVCLPREPSDEGEAEALSAILPVIFERCGFAESYSDNMWFKLKHGVAAWGVFWNSESENGLGDVDVRPVDLTRLFWQPEVRDLQDSRSVYLVEEIDEDALKARFPHYERAGSVRSHPAAGGGERVEVVDWYYKRRLPGGGSVLHYCKFAGDCLLFATENDPQTRGGWYEHGQYPFVLDVLYPTGDPGLGFGIIAMARDPQTYIDRMDRNLLEYMDWATRVRYFCKKNGGMREEEFNDLSRRLVEVEGDLGEERLRQITVGGLDSLWLELKNTKVDELKETTANRDFARGTTEGGVTAASAIAALQEAGSRMTRDIVTASYRSFVRVVRLVIECVRQFYTEARCFRILGSGGEPRYLSFSNAGIRGRVVGTLPDGTPLSRRPIFDIDVRAEQQDAYTRLSLNETLKELYSMGVFDPANAAAADVLLEGMDFEGVRRLRARVAAQAAGHTNADSAAGQAPASAEAPAGGHADLRSREELLAEATARAAAAGDTV